ncbi:MAG: FtsX-like permease family protein, partial [Planctomycetes bacterium]|nr:FtsX-like permease family protein [Planctomycetota bacterium]
ALLVGDSVRGSLRDLALERLGRIDSVLVAEQPFRAALAEELDLGESFEGVAPLLMASGSLSSAGRRATQLTVLGYEDSFWKFNEAPPPAPLTGNQCAISQAIADELHVAPGDTVLLRLPLPGSSPADSTLGEKTEAITSRRLQVAAVLPNEGLARFSLRPSQQLPRNVFVPLATLQKTLDLKDRVNLLAIGGKQAETPVAEADFEALQQNLAPSLEDFNVHVDQPPGFAYLRITTQRLVLPPALVKAVKHAANAQPAITYLANTIARGDRKIPYSTITGIDSLAGIGPLLDDQGKPIVLADDEIALNDWAADDLRAKVGDLITITYYEPETTHGTLKEGRPLELRLRAILPLLDDKGKNTLASDPHLTPDLPGVTDQSSIDDWNLPFELIEKVRSVDEDYWDQHSTTPKAFISYRLADRLWQTRWGTDSVLRIATATGATADDLRQQVRPDPAEMGLTLLSVKRQGLLAARGTTAFEGLFLGFSFFLMASAVMLIALLVKLGIESRCSEVGLLSAVGWEVRKLLRLLLGEAVGVVFVGTLLGVVGGIVYARLMIHGLTTWWVAATVTPFLSLHITNSSLALGATIGLLVALVTVWAALRKLIQLPARQLLSGDCTDSSDLPGTFIRSQRRWLPIGLLAVATTLAVFALRFQGEAQAGAFFGSGALVLAGLLIGLRQKLRRSSAALPRSLSLAGLAARNARRNPGRTLLSVGLAAMASFLIVALSAFRLAPSEQGTGGFELIATSDLPIHLDLGSVAGREELGFSDRDNGQLAGIEVYGFRVHKGEDASCLNLYQTSQPQLIGVPSSFYNQSKFGWSETSRERPGDPWQLLDLPLGADKNGRPIVPVVLDKNMAVYSLHLAGLGARFAIQDATNQPVTLQVVGLLSGSVLQGNVLMSEAHLLRLFPETAGQQLFLLRANLDRLSPNELSALLESQLEDYGYDAVLTTQRLADFLAVQNTYLSTFQSLGAWIAVGHLRFGRGPVAKRTPTARRTRPATQHWFPAPPTGPDGPRRKYGPPVWRARHRLCRRIGCGIATRDPPIGQHPLGHPRFFAIHHYAGRPRCRLASRPNRPGRPPSPGPPRRVKRWEMQANCKVIKTAKFAKSAKE